MDNNGEKSSLPKWVTVAKSQVIETLSTNTEAGWTDFITRTGRVTRSNTTTTGTVDICFIVKPIINDINEVVRGFLIATEGKEVTMLPRKLSKQLKKLLIKSARMR